MTIHIRKIDIDQCHRTDDEPPMWAWITASVNGVEARYRLTDDQTTRLLDAATPILMEQVAVVAEALSNRVVELRKRGPAA